jgi:branched-chain amino acid transport system ATP-binding protein
MSSATLLKTNELSVTFGGLNALSGLDLEINRREIVGLIGPNGAGKTTAFNAITGIVKPSRGDVFLRGDNITGLKSPQVARAGIARTFQNIRLYDDLTVTENVMVAGHAAIRYTFIEGVFGIGRFRSDEEKIYGKAGVLLEIMGLSSVANEKASSLPYGSQRKLEMARALALEPDLLLLDEPVAGMNPGETSDLGNIVLKLRDEMDLTVGLIEHDMGFVMGICDRIKVIDHGVPIAWGTPEQIRSDPKVIAAYLGESKKGE